MRLLAPAIVPVALLLLPLASAQHNYKTWKDFGGGPDSSKFVNLTQMNKFNVNQLTVAWTYPVRDRGTYRFNPIIVDNVMYVLARNSSLVALDATTGKEIWVHENLRGIAPSADGKLRAFDQDNGEVLWSADLPAASEGIPAMYEVNGKQYLVVVAAAGDIPGRPQSSNAADARAYVTFALPGKSKP